MNSVDIISERVDLISHITAPTSVAVGAPLWELLLARERFVVVAKRAQVRDDDAAQRAAELSLFLSLSLYQRATIGHRAEETPLYMDIHTHTHTHMGEDRKRVR